MKIAAVAAVTINVLGAWSMPSSSAGTITIRDSLGNNYTGLDKARFPSIHPLPRRALIPRQCLQAAFSLHGRIDLCWCGFRCKKPRENCVPGKCQCAGDYGCWGCNRGRIQCQPDPLKYNSCWA